MRPTVLSISGGSVRRFVRILVALVLMAALGACGSSGGSKGLSKAEFVTKAEAICAAGNAKIAKISDSFKGKNPSIEQFKSAYTDQLIPVFRSEIDDLRALLAPDADRDTIKKMLDTLSKGVDQAKSEVEAAKTQADLGKIVEPPDMKTASAQAKAYGLPTCGSDS
jgi:hypothetical protein